MIAEKKKELRKAIRELKKSVPFEEKKVRSEAITNRIEALPEFRESGTVMVYWSMKDEVHTHDFIRKWAPQKRIILPSVKGDELELRVFEGMESMQPGEGFGILEPVGPPLSDIQEIGLIIVPGVAFDPACQRMGRGKAYYDKLLRTVSCLRVGVCFDFQVVNEVPHDDFDVAMDKVVSESTVYRNQKK
jgi:5-formyltetrahydrofolate cyclo-ligase